jgi:hypothetical protein
MSETLKCILDDAGKLSGILELGTNGLISVYRIITTHKYKLSYATTRSENPQLGFPPEDLKSFPKMFVVFPVSTRLSRFHLPGIRK